MTKIETHLNNLRSKPEHVRRRIAFWSSLGITAVIFVFWLGAMTGVTTQASGAVADAVQKAGSPGESMLASVGSFFGDIKDMFFTPKKITYSTVEVSPGKN